LLKNTGKYINEKSQYLPEHSYHFAKFQEKYHEHVVRVHQRELTWLSQHYLANRDEQQTM